MVIGFVHLGVLDSLSEGEARRLLRALALVGLTYAVANSGVIPALSLAPIYRNAKFLFVAIAFAAAVGLRAPVRIAIVCALAALMFVQYPSATSPTVAAVTLLTLFVTRRTASSVRPYVAGGLILTVFVVALVNINKTQSITDEYFLAVGKRNNNTFRLTLYRAGIDQFRTSPIVGTGFSGEMVVNVHFPIGPARTALFHDDFIALAATGGVIGIGLFIGWFLLTEAWALSRHRRLLAAGQRWQAALLRATLVGFNAWLAAALFNPIIEGTAGSAALFVLYGLMMITGADAGLGAGPIGSPEAAATARGQTDAGLTQRYSSPRGPRPA
jgi:O-antigen ligase